MSSFLNISRVPEFQFLNKEADVSDEPLQSSSSPAIAVGKQPLPHSWLSSAIFYLAKSTKWNQPW